MYHWVQDKDYLKRAYSVCADIVNQLKNELEKDGIKASMKVVGSMNRHMVTQNEREPIDFDFNLFIEEVSSMDANALKETVRKAFNRVLQRNGWGDCMDSTSVLTTEQRVFDKGNKTPFSIDVCIVGYNDFGQLQRLKHEKTGFVQSDRWYWNEVPNSDKLKEKENFLKPKYWHEVRETYLEKKKMYLSRNDYNHPSFVCYIEAVNEVYSKKNGSQSFFRNGFFQG